jgi:hypothetical protein
MLIQSRATALQGQYARLYCRFIRDGVLADPVTPPCVKIVDDQYYQESSSSSSSDSDESSLSTTDPCGGNLKAVKENKGIWYVDWYVPDDLPPGTYYDIWKYKWESQLETETNIFEITVNKMSRFINSSAPAIVYKIDDVAASMMNDLSNVFIYEAMHIPVYWEQGYRTGNGKIFNFAFGNWNQDPRPTVRINQKIYPDGWVANYNGNVTFNKIMDMEDMIYAQYNFRYFTDEEILDFLQVGLMAMNATPPSSLTYRSLTNVPFDWRYGILLYAAIQALRRLVFGLNFQERALIFGERPEDVQNAINNFKALYSDYNALWIEVKKEIKTLKLPGISQIVMPEYTLPGGRSRWFRYLYKTGVSG